MSEVLRRLTEDDLRQLSAAIRAGRLAPPFTDVGVDRFMPRERAAAVAAEMQRLTDGGLKPEHLAWVLELLAEDRTHRQGVMDAIDLVLTGPEGPEAASRDTAVVVRELFRSARDSVLVAGYAVYQGRTVFRALADRMNEQPALRVRMFLDVRRGQGDTSAPAEVVRRFAENFRAREWPGEKIPEIFYDPRSLETDQAKKASLHAKCVVIDREVAFISSANFTEAAHARNIEVGVLIRSKPLAEKLARHFDGLVAAGAVQPAG